MKTLIKTENLAKAYGSFYALNGLSLEASGGQIIGLLGPNGCGKTTFMKVLAGLIKDYKGVVEIDGHTPGLYTKSILSYLPEKTYLSDWMKPSYAIDYFADFYSDFDKAKAQEMLRTFGLSLDQKIKTMSKGMQEKIQLILVMSRSSKIYLLDEPLSGIDPAARSVLLDIILNNYSENATLILSTHLIYDVERIFDRIIMMKQGRIEINNTVDDIRAQYGKSVDELFREVFRC